MNSKLGELIMPDGGVIPYLSRKIPYFKMASLLAS